ncbi:MAG: hypothetical protein J1F16_10850 [Muribaculaceae bacterium]|nr:hypothetical protein [Muribaculaceae bacterium]
MTATRELKMPSKQMLQVLFLQNGMPWISITAAGIVVFILCGIIFNIRFFVVALIWIFMVIPLVVAFLYFYYGMNPLTAFNSIPHKVIFDDSKVTLEFIDPQEKENEENNSISPRKEYTISREEFLEMKNGGKYVLLCFKKKGWIWLPTDSFEEFKQFKDVIASFSNNTISNNNDKK